ncbi:uncharacterized protein LTR77_008029 [Saxophila tyrrhenica]|uniref:Uncharacterized protein n=1 Tax=Saxophila tyrrhenica TaxID=1690608 RepID=A0AAV9P229_9PEZI|nr:hypothetical protein LTR77_008029 [Saxophila tyrrhenica]
MTTPPAEPADSLRALPNVPMWMIHAFAGCCAFVLTMAVVLILAQFPVDSAWVYKIMPKVAQNQTQYYMAITQDGCEVREVGGGGNYASAATDEEMALGAVGRRNAGARKRKPKKLSIDTTVAYHGLSIAVQGGEHEAGYHTFNIDKGHPKTPATGGWFTAPLLSVSTFFSQRAPTYSPAVKKEDENAELGCSFHMPFDHGATMHVNPATSPYETPPEGHERHTSGNGFLHKVNGSISSAVNKVAKTFHDQVTGAEEGLLLPVKGKERQAEVAPGVTIRQTTVAGEFSQA